MNLGPIKNKLYNDNDFINWKKRWEERLLKNNDNPKKYLKLMRNNNPLIIQETTKLKKP